MKELKVIGLVGRAGAGKDVVSQMIGSRYPSVRMGDVVIEETRRRGLTVTDSNVGMVASDLRRREGMDVIARRCTERIRSLDAPVVVVNGVRGPDEVVFFRMSLRDFYLVEVWAPDRLRYERIRARAREDDVSGYEQFLERDRREDSWGLGKAIAMADLRIANDGTLSDLEVRIRELVERIESDC